MKIDDILKQERFRVFCLEIEKLNSFLDEEMNQCAGKELVDKIIGLVHSKESARNWFYSSQRGLGYERPYDYCKIGKRSEVEAVIERIMHGVIQ